MALDAQGNRIRPGDLLRQVQAKATAAFAADTTNTALQDQRVTSKNRDNLQGQPTGPYISSSIARDVFLQTLKPETFFPNPLGEFDQPIYHFRFFMTEFDPKLQPPTPDNIKNLQQIVIAETGVSGYNIKDVQIVSLVGPNYRTQNVGTTSITITIVEPMGTSLLDRIYESALRLGMDGIQGNYRKIFYFLEITFKGYDATTGLAQSNILSDKFDNHGVWLYQMAIVDIETDLTVGGGTYVIKAIPYEETAFDDDALMLPDDINHTAQTIGDMLNKVSTSLNDTIKARYAGYQLTKFKFKFHTNKSLTEKYREPEKFELGASDTEHSSIRSNGMTLLNPDAKHPNSNGYVAAHFPRGTSIPMLVEDLFANSALAQQMAKNVPKTQAITENANESTVDRFRESYVVRCEPEMLITGFDGLTQQYQKDITYHIWLFATQMPVLSAIDVSNAKDPLVQKAMVKRLKEKGFLIKRYDYLFTGLNTEVLGVNLHFNLKWDAVVSQYVGMTQGQDDHPTVGEILRPKTPVEARAATQTLVQLSRDLNTDSNTLDILKGNPTPSADDLKTIADLTTKNAANQTKIDILTPYIKSNRVQSNVNQSLLRSERAARGATGISFAEDLPRLVEGNVDNRYPILDAITIIQNNNDPKYRVTGSMPGPPHRDKGIFGTVLDQIYAPMSRQLINIALEVKGDPYWLGATNLDRSLFLNDKVAPTNKLFPDFVQGDNSFLLTFKYPTELDETGAPTILQGNNTFNGVYAVRRITHSFSNGIFKQTLDAYVHPLIDVLKGFGIAVIDSPVNQQGAGQTSGGGLPTNINPSLKSNSPQNDGGTLTDQQTNAMNTLQGFGWSAPQSAGIVANLITESSLRPDAQGDPNSAGVNQAYGIAQWHPDRQADYATFAAQNPSLSPTIQGSSFNDQLAFVNYELTSGKEHSAGAALAATTTASDAGAIVSKQYERPAAVTAEADSRSALASVVLTRYNQQTAGVTPTVSSGAS